MHSTLLTIDVKRRENVSILSKVYVLGGRSRELDESARLVLDASTSGRCCGKTCAARPQRISF